MERGPIASKDYNRFWGDSDIFCLPQSIEGTCHMERSFQPLILLLCVCLFLNAVYCTALLHCYSIAYIKMICSSAYK